MIDQNYMREPNAKLHNYLKKGNRVVLTDFARRESFKGNSLVNLRRSLEIISKYPTQVIILRPTDEVIALSYKPTKGIRYNIVDQEETRGLSNFCKILYSQEIENPTSRYRRDIEGRSVEANQYFKDQLAYASKVLQSVALTQKNFSAEELKQIRNKEVYSQAVIEKIMREIMTVTMILMTRLGLPDKGLGLAKNCYIFRFSAACLLLSIKWISEGGYKNVPLEKFQNDIVDMNYAAYATYFDGLLSNDKKPKEVYRLLKQIFSVFR